jgi:hypothetical protein
MPARQQLNIRSDKAVRLARRISERENRPVVRVIEDALASYEEANQDNNVRLERACLMAAMQESWKLRRPDTVGIDKLLYDPETGLPA